MNAQQRDLIERLYRDHARGVGRYVLARVGDAELAELIVSRVYERVVDRIGQCRGEPAAWLWAIARTELALYYRTRRRMWIRRAVGLVAALALAAGGCA